MTTTPRSRDDDPVSREDTEPSAATWAWVAVVVSLVDLVAMVGSAVVAAANHQDMSITENGAWLNVVAGPSFPLLAALVFRSRGREEDRPPRIDRLARLLLAFGVLCTATMVFGVLTDEALRRHTPGALAVAWVSYWIWTGVAPGMVLILLWFPTGEAPGRRWRWVERGCVLAVTGMFVSVAFTPGPMEQTRGNPDNPLGWRAFEQGLHVVSAVGFGSLAVSFFAAVASLVVRFVRGDRAVRDQLRWVVAVVGVIALTVALPTDVLPGVGVALVIGSTFLLPVTLALALTRRDGYGLPRVMVYGFLSVLLLAAYLLLVAAAEAAFGSRADRTAAVLAAGLVAALVAPLRSVLQRNVERLLYGDRGDPHVALSDLGRRIAGSPGDLLHEVVGTVTDALRAPYAAVVLAGDSEPTAESGSPSAEPVVVPLALRGEEVGSLLVAPRSPLEPFGPRDLTLLEELARHIAVAAHTVALNRDLQQSRESLVIAREEERRRIRRDLHDGLGPALAGVAFGLDAARNTLSRDPAAVDASLAELKSELQASIADVRRLVYDLRPPELDQLGLVPALEEYAARLGERGALDVSVTAAALPALPAAVEVAAYRIATEALNNAARHAHARSTTVAIDVDGDTLRLEVADDGVGLNGHRGKGVGLTAMSERAEELGGRCSVTSREDGGTAVRAVLPLRAST